MAGFKTAAHSIDGVRRACVLVRNHSGQTAPGALFGAPGLHDIAAPEGCHLGALLAAMPTPSVWIQDGASGRDLGAPYASGLAHTGGDAAQWIWVRAGKPVDALWAMEEALKAGLPAIGEIEGHARALDFTATRRLALIAQEAELRCALVRTGPGAGAAGSAGMRWRIAAAPSAPNPHDACAPGAPRWTLELLRARDRPPGRWLVERDVGDDGAPRGLRVVPPLADRVLAPREGAAGRVLPLRPARAA